MEKTLIILRHGKAETAPTGKDDHERTLTERGLREAETMGQYMAKHSILPQKILCSTSVRTRQTLEHLTFLEKENIEYSPALYNASENQLLQIIATQPKDVSSLIVIGHNPGLHQLALRLAAQGDAKALHLLAADFPTCALAVINLGDSVWQQTAKARGNLDIFVTPKMV